MKQHVADDHFSFHQRKNTSLWRKNHASCPVEWNARMAVGNTKISLFTFSWTPKFTRKWRTPHWEWMPPPHLWLNSATQSSVNTLFLCCGSESSLCSSVWAFKSGGLIRSTYIPLATIAHAQKNVPQSSGATLYLYSQGTLCAKFSTVVSPYYECLLDLLGSQKATSLSIHLSVGHTGLLSMSCKSSSIFLLHAGLGSLFKGWSLLATMCCSLAWWTY